MNKGILNNISMSRHKDITIEDIKKWKKGLDDSQAKKNRTICLEIDDEIIFFQDDGEGLIEVQPNIELKTDDKDFFPYANDNRAKLWINNGIKFGYPKCCILHFIKNSPHKTREQDMVHKGTGFIPCPECAKKILEGEETLESLINNRTSKEPFR